MLYKGAAGVEQRNKVNNLFIALVLFGIARNKANPIFPHPAFDLDLCGLKQLSGFTGKNICITYEEISPNLPSKLVLLKFPARSRTFSAYMLLKPPINSMLLIIAKVVGGNFSHYVSVPLPRHCRPLRELEGGIRPLLSLRSSIRDAPRICRRSSAQFMCPLLPKTGLGATERESPIWSRKYLVLLGAGLALQRNLPLWLMYYGNKHFFALSSCSAFCLK